MWVQFVLISALTYFFIWLHTTRRKDGKKFAPGPNLFNLLKFGITNFGLPNYIQSATASKMFGSVFGMHLPSMHAVGVLDLEVAKKVMSSPDWINRLSSDNWLYEATFKKPLGLLFSNGEHWRQSRRFTIKTLHSFGFHRQRTMENFILLEINELHRRIESQLETIDCNGNRGKLTGELSPHLLFELPTLNIIWNLLAGVRFQYGDPDAEMLLNSCNLFNRQFNLGATIVDMVPMLRHVPLLSYIPGFSFRETWNKSHQMYFDYFKKIIAKRRAEGLYSEQPSDFMDYYLREIDNHKGDEPNYFTDESFMAVCTDMVLGAADTSNSTLEFAILHMALNPSIQEKVQDEIDRVIGQDRDPLYEDKQSMIYTQAVLLEVLRHASAVPQASRSPLEDNYINDYFVPKGSLVAINIHGIHFSDRIWTDPNSFSPERFLSEEEPRRIINSDKIIPFGWGKRHCLGESVASVTLFIFFTFLLQKYTFGLSKNHPRPSLESICGLSRCPIPYHVSISSRW